MPMSGETLRKLIPFPKPVDSLTLCADWESTAKAIDNVDEGQQDYLQAGVVEEGDWSFTATINSSTGAIGSSAATGGVAWLPDPVLSGALMRSVTTDAVLEGLAPSALPISGKYMIVGVELTASTWGAKATASLKSGSEYGTQAEAEAHSPATSEGKLRVRDLVIENASGVYSIIKQIDRRGYASGPQPGELRFTARPAVEAGWVACEGQALGRTAHSMLFAAIGTAYGEGDKATTFNVPDFRGRSPLGAGTGTATGATAHTLGSTVGEEKHLLIVEEMPVHNHAFGEERYVASAIGGGIFGQYVVEGGNARVAKTAPSKDWAEISHTGYEGAGEAHNNLGPSTVCNVWIKT